MKYESSSVCLLHTEELFYALNALFPKVSSCLTDTGVV